MNQTRTIAIVGGGFAGTTLARALDRKLPPGWELVLISEESYMSYFPSRQAKPRKGGNPTNIG